MSSNRFRVWLNNEYLSEHPEYSWIKEAYSKAVTQSVNNGQTAFTRFFNHESAFPKFKKKGRSDVKMYFVKNNPKDCRCERHRINIPSLGWVRIKEKGYIPTTKDGYVVKSGTVSMKADRYYVSVLVEISDNKIADNSNAGIGIDLGLKDFAIVSNGKTYKNINKSARLKKLEKQLIREQRCLSRKYENLKKGEVTQRTNIQKISLRLCREEGRTMHNHNMLEVNNLSKNFAGTGRETEFAAVDGISFTLDAGECLGLIGESGCGKSTTARLITGLVQADAGSVLLEGEEILGRKGRRQREVYRKIQMVFQTPQDSFDPMQTLESGILEAFRNQGMSRKEACLHLPELLKKVELSSETAMRYPRETSGGECQRAAIARALAVQPSLLICDEATSALDAAVQAQIVQLLKKLQREEGLAMLWIGHDLALVRELCSRVIVMRQGKIVEQGETREVLEYPKEEYTKLLMEYSL